MGLLAKDPDQRPGDAEYVRTLLTTAGQPAATRTLPQPPPAGPVGRARHCLLGRRRTLVLAGASIFFAAAVIGYLITGSVSAGGRAAGATLSPAPASSAPVSTSPTATAASPAATTLPSAVIPSTGNGQCPGCHPAPAGRKPHSWHGR